MPLLNLHSRQASKLRLQELLSEDQARLWRNKVRRIISKTMLVAWAVVSVIAWWLVFPQGRHTPLAWWRFAFLGIWALASIVGGIFWVLRLNREHEAAELTILRFSMRKSRAHQPQSPQPRRLRQARRGR